MDDTFGTGDTRLVQEPVDPRAIAWPLIHSRGDLHHQDPTDVLKRLSNFLLNYRVVADHGTEQANFRLYAIKPGGFSRSLI